MTFYNSSLQDLVNHMIKSRYSSIAFSHATSSLLLRDLFDASLSRFISEGAGDCSKEVLASAVGAGDAPPSSYLTGEFSLVEHVSQCRNIFLSGVTGFLGCHLLQDLIENSSANVHCLVRVSSASQIDAKCRLNDCLRKYKVTLTSQQLTRVIVHSGDLTLPLFGMPEDQFLRLSQSLDVVVHNGAHVNWLMTYAQLRPANVLVRCNVALKSVLLHASACHFCFVLGNCDGVALGSRWEA